VLHLERPVLMGRSNGAVTAALVAANHPDLVRAVVLEEPPSGGMPRPAIRQEQVGQQNWFQAWLRWMEGLKRMPHATRLASAIARWPHGLPVPPDEPVWPEDDFVPYVEALAQFDTNIFKHNIGYWSLVPYLERVAGITCPVLLVAGNPELGSLVPAEVADELCAAWSYGQCTHITEAGHIISRGRTHDRFMQVVQPFLSRLQ
jgi:N-formylmaleamate deformylase